MTVFLSSPERDGRFCEWLLVFRESSSICSLSVGNFSPPSLTAMIIVSDFSELRRDVIALLRASPPFFEQLRVPSVPIASILHADEAESPDR